ncbi:MAG: pilus assembly protein [Pseudomonadota bacterium]|nr:pilus assembly protein [Pseudomonadota bacterium]
MMRPSLRNHLRDFAGDRRGFSAVEFGILAPVLLVFVIGIGDLGRGLSERHALQQAANRTLELAHLGTRQADYSYLIPEAATAAGVPQTNVTLEQWLECDGNSTTRLAFGASCPSGQQIARYLTLTIRSSFTPMFSSAGYLKVLPDGSVRLTAQASLRVQ